MLCYRIVKEDRASGALSGEGARLFGGRWNPPGWRCVYAASSRALAALELLVHLPAGGRRLRFVILTLEIDVGEIAEFRARPGGWDILPPGEVSQSVGLAWLRGSKSAGLRVPSVVIPQEENVLLNPEAPGFRGLREIGRETFAFDRRLPFEGN